ncbi:hypothetical protein D3C87_1693250 [compost metagenome]
MRIYRPTRPNGAANRNGRRQPQLCRSSTLIQACRPATNTAPNNKPAAVLAGTMLVYKPRLPSGAYSARKADAPAYSPEAENPWNRRINNNRAGAHRPIWL